MIRNKNRIISKLAYRYWLKNKTRNEEQNWNKALRLFNYMEKRKTLIERIIK